jgi:hypothetical protein
MNRSIARRIIIVATLIFISEGFAMRSMSYLEKYDLEDLSYIRMQSGECGSRPSHFATILDPEGLPHTVHVGNYVGKHHGMIKQITKESIKVIELQPFESGFLERTVFLPRVEGKAPRARFRYEEDRALYLLGEIDAIGRRLRERLIECRKLFGEDAQRLACFDEAVGTFLP